MIFSLMALTPPPSMKNESPSSLLTLGIITSVLFLIFLIICIVFKKKRHPIFAILFLVFSVACAVTAIGSFIKIPRSRSAKDFDISIELSQEFTLNNEYEVKPNRSIDNLEITFTYYDSQNRVISTKEKTVGNVKSGQTYLVTVSLSEFSLTELLKINYCKAEVTGGKVWE